MHANSPSTPVLGEALNVALEHEKRRFLARNLDRCGYLRVLFEPGVTAHQVVIAATFTLDAALRWHRVEAILDTLDQADAGGLVAEAFRTIDDAIGTARIAHLFAPLALAGAADHRTFG